MAIALLLVVNLGILEGAFVAGTIQAAKTTALEKIRSRTFYAAQAGAQAALKKVDKFINGYLQTTIKNASPSGIVTDAKARVNSGDGIGWLVNAVSVDSNNDGVRELILALDGDQALYSFDATTGTEDYTFKLDNVNYNYKITFTEKADPVAVGLDKWDFAYIFRIESNGVTGSMSSQVVVTGDFTVRLQKDNFAKFALYTNSQDSPNGARVWFTGRTLFYGPVHTNDLFNFAYNPSGTFQMLVTQVQAMARFMDGGSETLMNSDHNGTEDVPVFKDGFNRGVPLISGPAGTTENAMITEATNGSTYSNAGVYLPTTSNGKTLTAGIYVKGDCSITMSVNAQDQAVYSIHQTASNGSTIRKDITVDPSGGGQTTLTDYSQSPVKTYSYIGTPVGVSKAGTIVYVTGAVVAFEGIVQKDTEITVASHGNLTISNNVKYAVYTPGVGTPGTEGYVPPAADNPDPNGAAPNNLLGLVSWAGAVHIAQSAPYNIEIHATIMATSTANNAGYFQADSWDNGSARGFATLLGGLITNDYGAFGQMNSNGDYVHGYGRNFVYDQRMMQSKSPPYYPSLSTFIAFTNDITDKLVWQGMN